MQHYCIVITNYYIVTVVHVLCFLITPIQGIIPAGKQKRKGKGQDFSEDWPKNVYSMQFNQYFANVSNEVDIMYNV